MHNIYQQHPFILANKAEVKRMCLTEYNEAKTMRYYISLY